MKIVFLDMDGVLNRLNRFGSLITPKGKQHTVFRVDPSKSEMINQWAVDHNIHLVISSTWRLSLTKPEFLAYSRLSPLVLHPDWQTQTSHETSAPHRRLSEIQSWVAAHPTTERWVAIDDMEVPTPHLILINPQHGLQAADLDTALEYLNA